MSQVLKQWLWLGLRLRHPLPSHHDHRVLLEDTVLLQTRENTVFLYNKDHRGLYLQGEAGKVLVN